MHIYMKALSLVIVFILSISILSISEKTMAEDSSTTTTTTATSEQPGVYIIYTEQPPEGADPEAHHLSTLSSVVGSEEAAKEAILYVYKSASTGFSAKLTADQKSQLEKQPGVLQIVASQTLQLHSGGGGAETMRMNV